MKNKAIRIVLLLALGTMATTAFTPKPQSAAGAASIAETCQASELPSQVHTNQKGHAGAHVAASQPAVFEAEEKAVSGNLGRGLLSQVIEGLTGTALAGCDAFEPLRALRCFGLEVD